MENTTLEKLQQLKSYEFHKLCDELLPRLDAKYFSLRPYGRNNRGDNIKGQPDSYIGNTAKTCNIAIQYTVQKKDWWSKAIEDVKDAKKGCPGAEEIVLALPLDVNRDKIPKGKYENWLDLASTEAAPAKLSLFDGPTLVQQLDGASQDLRKEYLDVPFSRLSWYSILSSSRKASSTTLDRLRSTKRYDAKCYVEREADTQLFKMWQNGLRNVSDRSQERQGRTFIPLIADSGIGKTSLFAHFVEKNSSNVPVLFLLARDLSFNQDDSLIRKVIEQLQGSMDIKLRDAEEAHLADILKGKTPLTVILDGLDETANPSHVKNVIGTWLRSKLGEVSVLITSSRPEFWRTCKDSTWATRILQIEDHSNTKKLLRHKQELGNLDPIQGINLPGKLSSQEALKTWQLAGCSEPDWWNLNAEIRQELAHPFTMKTTLDLLEGGTDISNLRTRTDILTLSIQSRLQSVEDQTTLRISESHFRDCLRLIAKAIDESSDTWISVDSIIEVPRFDQTHPPGPVVEKLITANILETHPERHDHLRFSFEAVHDYFLAESIITQIESGPEAIVNSVAALSFSKAITRLERIGQQITDKPIRNEFVKALAERDAPMAAVVIRSDIAVYSVDCRKFIVEKLAEMLNSRMIAKQKLATQLLGRMKCPEAAQAIENHWLKNKPSKNIWTTVSFAVISHGIVSLIPRLFETWWFTRDYFFINLRFELLGSTEEFQEELIEHARKKASLENEEASYRKAITVLAYLASDFAVEAIRKKATEPFPAHYECSSLLVFGSKSAVKLYSEFVEQYVQKKTQTENYDEDVRHQFSIEPQFELKSFATAELEAFAVDLVNSSDECSFRVGCKLAYFLGSENLQLLVFRKWNDDPFYFDNRHEQGRQLGADKWLEWWNLCVTKNQTNLLISMASELRDTRVEDKLIECLVRSDNADKSAKSLAEMGSLRSCPILKDLLIKDNTDDGKMTWNKHMAYISLAKLRDPFCVDVMVKYLESEEGIKDFEGCIGLAAIGTEEAKKALLTLRRQPDESYVKGLIYHGSRECIEKAIDIAKQNNHKAGWLLRNCQSCFTRLDGWERGKYRTDVDLEPLLKFVEESDRPDADFNYIRCLLDDVDSVTVRKYLRGWYALRDGPNEADIELPNNAKLSNTAFRSLADRGDESVLGEFLTEKIEHLIGYELNEWDIEGLSNFNRNALRDLLLDKLQSDIANRERAVFLEFIGHFGDPEDVAVLDDWIEVENDQIANAAFDAKLRLTDPLRLTTNW